MERNNMNRTTDETLQGYDVIGDVHGHLHALEGLLARLEYARIGGSWQHPSRQAIFVGDLIDRGSHQVEVARLVQRMVATGAAQIVLGNHEYNALAWATPIPGDGDRFCRKHNARNRDQHAEFLKQVGEGSALHAELLDWFRELPLWLELSLGDARLRVVHACWSQPAIDRLATMLSPTRSLTNDAVVATSVHGSAMYDALEVVLKGPEVDLDGLTYLDKGGHERRKARRRWWDPTATTLRSSALIPGGSRTPDGKPFPVLPDTEVDPFGRYDDDVPVIVGHYWCQAPLELYSSLVACVDYSVARNGPLVAYRWSGESKLSVEHYVAHPVAHPGTEDSTAPIEDV